ncbi:MULTISPECIES: response regulator transcription factor [Caproicibacterium]|uniref:Stage 0 sporulation protein A homolog n=1 Tax=Caproicibacterium argilliputei TaxID=3030016 RepID=A0AA97DBQ9_9FIRM|nr:response regulator [Caproicibacterium argilliputei]WOC32680.1 response regulator [Caproicibacterium argilliputei]
MAAPLTYKYIVAEDEPLIRHNVLKKVASLHLPLEAVGSSGDGQTALELVKTAYPHFVITDIRMPVMDGLRLAHYLYDFYPAVKCVILSGYDDFKYAQEALKYGVSDFLLKPLKTDELRTALQKIVLNLDAEHQNCSAMDTHGLSAEELNRLLTDYLRTNFRTDISLSRLSEQFGFSQEYLTKVFKKYNGETPLKFISRLRVSEAQQLLVREPEMEVKQVGEHVGYAEPAYFSRVFKSCTGEYPSEYRLHHVKS